MKRPNVWPYINSVVSCLSVGLRILTQYINFLNKYAFLAERYYHTSDSSLVVSVEEVIAQMQTIP